MKLISIRSQIREVASRFAEVHRLDPNFIPSKPDVRRKPSEKGRILIRLKQLDTEKATPEDVAEIIGNSSWVTQNHCDECGGMFDTVIQLGEEPDYESSTAVVCLSCLKKAVAIAESECNKEKQ